jgi:hypothetical protein
MVDVVGATSSSRRLAAPGIVALKRRSRHGSGRRRQRSRVVPSPSAAGAGGPGRIDPAGDPDQAAAAGTGFGRGAAASCEAGRVLLPFARHQTGSRSQSLARGQPFRPPGTDRHGMADRAATTVAAPACRRSSPTRTGARCSPGAGSRARGVRRTGPTRRSRPSRRARARRSRRDCSARPRAAGSCSGSTSRSACPCLSPGGPAWRLPRLAAARAARELAHGRRDA